MPAASAGAMFAPLALGILRKAVGNATKVLRKKATALAKSVNHVGARGQPVHPSAVLHQQQRRMFSRLQGGSSNAASKPTFGSVLRRLISTASGSATKPRFDRSKFPSTHVSRAVSQLPRTPFAHTLRPNLTGGTLPRSAGGYGLTGGGQRYFSHVPEAPAQVIQNVSQAMRCFLLQGKRTKYDGVDPRTGRPRYRAVSALEDETTRKMASYPKANAPGSFVDFRLSPTITAMSPLAAAFPFPAAAAEVDETHPTTTTPVKETPYARAVKTQRSRITSRAKPTTLLAGGFLDELSIDIARALKDLSAALGDVRRLSSLGDLAVELVHDPSSGAPSLRVKFPGVDMATVESLCDDMGVTRGIVGQDPEFDSSIGIPVALKFPFAPDNHHVAAAPFEEEDEAMDCFTGFGAAAVGGVFTSPHVSVRSLEGNEFEDDDDTDLSMSEAEEAFLLEEFSENPWMTTSEPEGYGSLVEGSSPSRRIPSEGQFEGIEGIYRFISECDHAKGRFRGN